MNNSKRVKCYIRNGGSSKRCLLNSVYTGNETGTEILESSRLELLEKFLANNSTLSDADDNTSGPLNRGGIADLL